MKTKTIKGIGRYIQLSTSAASQRVHRTVVCHGLLVRRRAGSVVPVSGVGVSGAAVACCSHCARTGSSIRIRRLRRWLRRAPSRPSCRLTSLTCWWRRRLGLSALARCASPLKPLRRLWSATRYVIDNDSALLKTCVVVWLCHRSQNHTLSLFECQDVENSVDFLYVIADVVAYGIQMNSQHHYKDQMCFNFTSLPPLQAWVIVLYFSFQLLCCVFLIVYLPFHSFPLLLFARVQLHDVHSFSIQSHQY